MALGLRQYVIRGIKPLIPHLALILFVLGLGLLISMPIQNRRNIYISENGLMPDVARDKFPLEQSKLVSYLNEEWKSQPAVERVTAPTGRLGETLLLVVSSRCPGSVALGKALIDSWRRSQWLALDIEVRFVANLSSFSATEALSARVVRGALLLDVCNPERKICLETIGSGAQLPNLDVVNSVIYSSTRRGFNFDVTCSSTNVEYVLEQAEPILSRSLGLDHWKEIAAYWIHFVDMLNDEETKGPQAPLREAGVHAITLRNAPNAAISEMRPPLNRLLALGAVVEMWSRSLNNLNERIHHSFFLYYHMSPRTFVDNEVAQSQAFAFMGSIALRIFVLLPQAGHGGILFGVSVLGLTLLGVGLSALLESFYVFPAFPLIGVMVLFLGVVLTHEAGRQGVYLSASVVLGTVNASVLCGLVIVHPPLSVVGGLCLSLATSAALTVGKRRLIGLSLASWIVSFGFLLILRPVLLGADDAILPTNGVVRLFFWGFLFPTLLLPVAQLAI